MQELRKKIRTKKRWIKGIFRVGHKTTMSSSDLPKLLTEPTKIWHIYRKIRI